MGIRRKHHGTVLGATLLPLMFEKLRTRFLKRGMESLEMSWILEDNMAMRRVLEGLGGKVYKKHRVFEKALGGNGGLSAIDALILAGSRGPNDPVAALGNVEHKALLPIAGKPMVSYVLEAVRDVPEVARIFVCIDDGTDLSTAAGAIAFQRIPPASSPAASMAAALQAIDGQRPLLVTTADHPLLTTAMIRHFLDHASKDAGLSVGLAEATTVNAAFPEGERTFYRLAGKGYSGCNLFLARRPGAGRVAEYWRRMETHRKKPLRLVREIGVGALIRYALGLLSLDAAFAHVSRLTGATIKPVLLPFAEAATDVDKPSDFVLVEGLLKKRLN